MEAEQAKEAEKVRDNWIASASSRDNYYRGLSRSENGQRRTKYFKVKYFKDIRDVLP